MKSLYFLALFLGFSFNIHAQPDVFEEIYDTPVTPLSHNLIIQNFTVNEISWLEFMALFSEKDIISTVTTHSIGEEFIISNAKLSFSDTKKFYSDDAKLWRTPFELFKKESISFLSLEEQKILKNTNLRIVNEPYNYIARSSKSKEPNKYEITINAYWLNIFQKYIKSILLKQNTELKGIAKNVDFLYLISSRYFKDNREPEEILFLNKEELETFNSFKGVHVILSHFRASISYFILFHELSHLISDLDKKNNLELELNADKYAFDRAKFMLDEKYYSFLSALNPLFELLLIYDVQYSDTRNEISMNYFRQKQFYEIIAEEVTCPNLKPDWSNVDSVNVCMTIKNKLQYLERYKDDINLIPPQDSLNTIEKAFGVNSWEQSSFSLPNGFKYLLSQYRDLEKAKYFFSVNLKSQKIERKEISQFMLGKLAQSEGDKSRSNVYFNDAIKKCQLFSFEYYRRLIADNK